MKKILVVDDERSVCEVIKVVLEKEGYRTDIVYDAENVDIRNIDKYKLVVLDVMMPGKDGYQLCDEIRKQSNVPILFLSAKSDEKDIVEGFMRGGDDYLTKPFSINEFMCRITALIKRCYANRDKERKVISVGDLRIDEENGMVCHHNRELKLTKTEYKLMLLFAHNQRKVLSKDDIHYNLWSTEVNFKGDDTINVHIKNLRRKLEGTNIKIKNIWGRGYKVEIAEEN